MSTEENNQGNTDEQKPKAPEMEKAAAAEETPSIASSPSAEVQTIGTAGNDYLYGTIGNDDINRSGHGRNVKNKRVAILPAIEELGR